MLTSWNEYHTESSLLPAAGLLIPVLLAANLLKSILLLSSLPTVNSFQLASCWLPWCRDPEAQLFRCCFELHLSLSGVINILIPECTATIFIGTIVQRQQGLQQNSPWRETGRHVVNDQVWEWGAGGHLPQLSSASTLLGDPEDLKAHFWVRQIREDQYRCSNCPAVLFVLAVIQGDVNIQLYGDQNSEHSCIFLCSGQDVCYATWLLISQRSRYPSQHPEYDAMWHRGTWRSRADGWTRWP